MVAVLRHVRGRGRWVGGCCVGGVAMSAAGSAGAGVGVGEVLSGWRPVDPAEAGLVDLVLGSVRGWVAAAEPVDEHDARRLLRAVTGLALWAYRTAGVLDVETVFFPANVELWVMGVNAHRSGPWRHVTRGVLRRVGRAVNPDGWPPVAGVVGRTQVAAPYGPDEERIFKLSAALFGRVDRAARLWVAAAGCGGGLSGSEIAASRIADVVAVDDDRLAVRVRGRHERFVPIRRVWTDTARAAIDTASSAALTGSSESRFVTAQGRNAVHQVVERLAPGGGVAFSLRRARSTWLAAHLAARTPLAVLRVLAGPLSANTLDALVRSTAAQVVADDAYLKGLDI